MKLTAEQRAVVGQEGALATVSGGAGTGKTTALRHRYLRLAREAGAGQVLVVTRSRAAADRFRDAVLADLAGGFDMLPITTIWGLAHDRVARTGQEVRLLSREQHRESVASLLAAEAGDSALWPSLHPFVGRAAFAAEAAAAVTDLSLSLADPAVTGDPRWQELARFAVRYADQLRARSEVDFAGLLAAATRLPAGGSAYTHVLVDDYDEVTLAGRAVLEQVIEAASPESVTVATSVGTGEFALTCRFRRPAAPELVHCGHPSLEAEAIAGELLAASAAGVPWGDMAVLVRDPEHRGADIARALARHGVPLGDRPASVAAEPTVQGLVALVDWARGDAGAVDRVLASPVAGIDPAEVRALRRESRASGAPVEDHPRLVPLVAARDEVAKIDDDRVAVHHAFARTLGHLVLRPAEPADPSADRVLDAVVAFLADRERARSSPMPDRVTVTAIGASRGEEWPLVVVAGCLEGELPRLRTAPRFFDRDALSGTRPTPPERRARVLADERALFALATTRATARLIGTAAPEPGVLVSRFVGDWTRRHPTLPLSPEREQPSLGPTKSNVPVWPERSLRLSATQLEMYEDCPLRYAYRYVAGARNEAGIHAGLGSLVHRVLERFLDPEEPGERSHDRLLELAEECWHDDIAPYRPQQEEARRDLYDMLELWWEKEGSPGGGPHVLATEHRFDVTVGPHQVRGAIDRVDRADDGVGIRVVDYKTGKSKPRAADVKTNLQLSTYYVAATHDPELAAWGPPSQLRLLHVRSMTPFDQEVRPDHGTTTEAQILEAADRILDEQYEPSVHANCDHCDFHRLCPLWPEGRHVGEAV